MTETRFPNGIKGGNGTDLELKSDSDIALYATNNIWISQGTKLIFEGTVPDDFEAKLQATSVTADRDIILPDASGTIALTSDIPIDISDLTDTGNLLSGGTAFTTADVDTHLNTSSATSGQVLGWNGSDYAWSSTSGLQIRTTAAHTTASLPNAAIENFSLNMAKSFSLMSIETSAASWVRLYVNSASRTADASRSQGQDPDPDSGVIAEIITTGAETVVISPATIGFNLENPVTTSISCTITNLSGSTQAITVTTTYLKLEA